MQHHLQCFDFKRCHPLIYRYLQRTTWGRLRSGRVSLGAGIETFVQMCASNLVEALSGRNMALPFQGCCTMLYEAGLPCY